LTQYLLAVDRNNDALGELYDPLHPAVLKLLAQIIATATRAKKPVTLCGEMAADTRCTPLLMALGLTGFSMHPSSLLEVRQAIAACDHARLRKLAPRLLRAQTKAALDRVLGSGAETRRA
ncbi:MAG: phosphoenolpyruvate--protein phosphotransferase, partial [Proteobacteria bacterium]|nr:phosphoenolpyruvate--protein phosphotransferase [Pseudomonadota bacterium]